MPERTELCKLFHVGETMFVQLALSRGTTALGLGLAWASHRYAKHLRIAVGPLWITVGATSRDDRRKGERRGGCVTTTLSLLTSLPLLV